MIARMTGGSSSTSATAASYTKRSRWIPGVGFVGGASDPTPFGLLMMRSFRADAGAPSSGCELGELHRLQTEASAEVLFDTRGRSLIGRCCCHHAAGVDDRSPRHPRSEVADEHRSPRAQDRSRAPSDGARAAEARAPWLLTAAVARGRSSRHGGGLREPRHLAGG